MLCRFASAASVASALVALAISVVGLSPVLSFARVYPLPVIWCVVPLVWGVWAIIVPRSWLAHRLPLWGAILGFIAGVFAFLVLNLPSRIFAFAVPLVYRMLGLLVLTFIYYFCWVVVELVYESLEHHTGVPKARPT